MGQPQKLLRLFAELECVDVLHVNHRVLLVDHGRPREVFNFADASNPEAE